MALIEALTIPGGGAGDHAPPSAVGSRSLDLNYTGNTPGKQNRNGRGGQMESTILDLASQQGVWAALFVFLLIYVLKTSGDREKKLIEALDNLKDVKEGVDRIEERIDKLEGR